MNSGMRTVRRPRKNKYNPEVVKDWQESGLAKSEYARRNDIHPNVLNRWIARYEEEKQRDTFVRVDPKGLPSGYGSIFEIVLPDGITIRLSGSDVSAVQVGTLVNTLRGL